MTSSRENADATKGSSGARGASDAAKPLAAARGGLGPLVRPVFVPSLIYATGASALVPAQVLLALQLGFTPAGVAGMMTWVGAFSIASAMIAGRLVDRFGERRSLAVVTLAGVLGLLAVALSCALGVHGRQWILLAALTLFDLVDGVWSIARQGIVADRAPAAIRGRAMNIYGACQRLGRIGGPLVAAVLLAVAGPAAVFPAAALIVVLALTSLLRATSLSPAVSTDEVSATAPVPKAHEGASPPEPVASPPAPRWWRHRMMLLGAGVLVLSALRTGKETLLPVWAAQGVHLDGTQVALVLAAASGAELMLFWPAGLALDRYGRAPVVVTAMALMSLGMCLTPLGRSPFWLLACVLLIGSGDGAGAGIIKVLGVDLAPADARATFLGRWQAIASTGSLLAPAMAGAAISVASLPAALVLLGAVGVVGSAWMAWWTPKLVPLRDATEGDAPKFI